MADKIYWREVLVFLRRIIHATDLQSKRVAKVCGLTIPQVMVLNSIDQLGDVTVKRISDEVSLSQATVTTILNRLEDRGLLVEVVLIVRRKRFGVSAQQAQALFLAAVLDQCVL